MNKYCYIYIRVSTDKQAESGYSLENQRKACFDFAKSNDYEVLDIFEDEGETARNNNRPMFQKMIAALKERPVNSIIFYKIDRFFRNVSDFSAMRKMAKEKGLVLLSALENDVTSGIIGNIFASVAEWESEIIGHRTKVAMEEKFKEGTWPGWAPLGYNNVRDENDKGKIEINALVAPLIKKGFELYASGNYSIFSLQRKLHKLGLRARRGKELQFSVLNNIIRNSFYYGLMKWNGLERIGTHQPIIFKDLFDRCQYVAARNRNFLVRKRKYNFLLRGFVRCEVCGLRYVAEWHKINSRQRDKIGYYHCSKRGGCSSPNVEIGDLENQVAEEIKKLEFSPEFIRLVGQEVKHIYEQTVQNIGKIKQALVNKLTGLETKRDNLEERLADDTIDSETYKRLHQKIQTRIDEVNLEIIKADRKRQIDVGFIEEVLVFTRNVYQTYLDAPTHLKRHYVRFFVDKFWIKDKLITKVDYSPLFSALQENHLVILRSNWLPGLDSNQRP